MDTVADENLAGEVTKRARKIERGTVAWEYMSQFNINLDRDYNADTLYVPELWHPVMADKYPAIVYKLRNNEAKVSRFWITYLEVDGTLATLEKDSQRISPHSISPQLIGGKSHAYWAEKLKPEADYLRICFNPLDALVLSDTEDKDCAVCVTTDAFKLPDRVKSVEIYCRHSKSFRYEQIMYTLAARLKLEGIAVEVNWPYNGDNNWCGR